jgi:UDP-N-acetylmuramoylalanine--D-glutamate ligase
MGVTPVLVDDAAEGSCDGIAILPTGRGGLEALAACDVVVKAPGISRHRDDARSLVDRGVALAGGLGLWMEEVDRDRVVCITGTKGKSTTAAVAGHLLNRLGYRCLVAGNIGRPPYDPDVGTEYDFWVVETSSFQATDLASSPPVVAVTSLHPDHLDWHGDVATYYRDKLSMCTRPGARVSVVDGASALLHQHRSLLGPEIRWVTVGDPELVGGSIGGGWTAALGLVGEHNHRTNVLSTLAALEAFHGRRVALIVGGFDRGIDYRPLREGLTRRIGPLLLLTLPPSGPRIRAAVAGGPPPSPDVADYPDLRSATSAAFEWARPDGVVLLSPAAPSFGQFRDYSDRSDAFADAMRACGAPPR